MEGIEAEFFQMSGVLVFGCNERELGFLSCDFQVVERREDEETAHRVVGGGKWTCHVMAQRVPK